MWVVLNSKSTSWNVVERLLFPAPEASYTIKSFPDELIVIPRADGCKVPCLFLPFKHARFLFLYFHANAEDIGLCYQFCSVIRDLFQVHVLAVEYPGYGICPGKTDEEGIMANATAAMQFATETLRWPCDGIKIFGRSIGTGAAIALASKYQVAGVILVSPFTSIQQLFRSQVGPLADLVEDRFRNLESAEKITSPLLIIHGQQDTLVPLDHGKRIYEACQVRKMLVCPAAMSHNTSLLKNVGTFVLPMTQFFSLPDYTFEDIEVPAWAYPSNVDPDVPHIPRPRAGYGAKVIDSMTTPARFPAPSDPQTGDAEAFQAGGNDGDDEAAWMPTTVGLQPGSSAPFPSKNQDASLVEDRLPRPQVTMTRGASKAGITTPRPIGITTPRLTPRHVPAAPIATPRMIREPPPEWNESPSDLTAASPLKPLREPSSASDSQPSSVKSLTARVDMWKESTTESQPGAKPPIKDSSDVLTAVKASVVEDEFGLNESPNNMLSIQRPKDQSPIGESNTPRRLIRI